MSWRVPPVVAKPGPERGDATMKLRAPGSRSMIKWWSGVKVERQVLAAIGRPNACLDSG
jgi:hypothetical protein